MLNIPDIRQTADYDCGEAAVDAVLRFLGVRTSTQRLADEYDGTHPANIELALRSAGLRIQSGNMTIEDLKHHTRLGRPVLCSVEIYGGHWVVVAGVSQWRVHFHCPSNGPDSLTRRDWVDKWVDRTRSGHSFDSWGIAVWSHES